MSLRELDYINAFGSVCVLSQRVLAALRYFDYVHWGEGRIIRLISSVPMA